MTQKEIKRLRVINQTIDKIITIKEAAEILGVSEPQVIRLKGDVLKTAPAFIFMKIETVSLMGWKGKSLNLNRLDIKRRTFHIFKND